MGKESFGLEVIQRNIGRPLIKWINDLFKVTGRNWIAMTQNHLTCGIWMRSTLSMERSKIDGKIKLHVLIMQQIKFINIRKGSGQ